ncbi:MAG: DNA repair protein RecO [Patescibacteria group bacterium]
MYYNLTAIILKREVFREDDLILTAYSLERGKSVLQVRGGKKIKSKLAGHLEPISLSNLEIVRGKQIDQLIGASLKNSYNNIKGDLIKLAYASYFLELILNLTKENYKDERIFNLLRKALDFLDRQEISKTEYKLARISFGFKMLFLLGFSPVEKAGLKHSDKIDFVTKSDIGEICASKQAIDSMAWLNRVLNKELEDCLEVPIKTKNFFKYVQNG